MYLEFRLPSGTSGLAASHSLYRIREDLDLWADKYQTPYKYKIVKYTLRIFLKDLETYTFFGLTWDPEFTGAKNYKLVEPMDPPKSN